MRHRRGNFRIGLIALCALWPGRGVKVKIKKPNFRKSSKSSSLLTVYIFQAYLTFHTLPDAHLFQRIAGKILVDVLFRGVQAGSIFGEEFGMVDALVALSRVRPYKRENVLT